MRLPRPTMQQPAGVMAPVAGQNNYQPAVQRNAAPPPKDELAGFVPAAQSAAPMPAPAPAVNAAPQAQPQAAPPAPTKQQETPKEESKDFISQKIYKINGKDKVVDFNSKLTMATLQDFANVHGCGGSGHAMNSTIGLTICDYTKGKGDNSITVKYAVDVEDLALLHRAAMDARLGILKPSASSAASLVDSMISQIHTWKGYPVTANKEYVIPGQAINGILEAAGNVRNAIQGNTDTPVFSYVREKVHGHKTNGNGMAPVTKVQIHYSPLRRGGAVSTYPWYLCIENFDAPINRKNNGATTYDGSKAANKRTAFINLSADDFAAAMVAVDRFIRLWEHRMIPVMEEAYRRIEAARQQTNGYQ